MRPDFHTTADCPDRIEVTFGGLTRFASVEYIIKQAARNGQRRLR